MSSGTTTFPPDIAASWLRVRSAGLRPDTPLDRAPFGDFDRRSRLRLAATPVLDELRVQLEDTKLCLLMADHDCRIIDRRFTDSRVETVLNRIGVVPGVHFAEEVSGTNSVATSYETRGPVFVNGQQHFLEPLKQFSCYGHPIRNPVTRRVEGVLDITGIMQSAHPLFAPLVQHAVRDIEQRLLGGSRAAERHLLAAFRSAAPSRSSAVVVLGEDVVLSNSRALDLLDGADHALLRSLAPDLPAGKSLDRRLTLASGRSVTAHVERIDGCTGMLVRLMPTTRPSQLGARPASQAGSAVDRELVRLAGGRTSVLVAGEPGSGRTTAARVIASSEEVAFLDAATVPSAGEAPWARRLETLANSHPGVLVVEDVHLLPAVLAARLSRLIAEARPRMVLTCAPRDTLAEDVSGLAAACVSSVDLPPLRNRRDEMPALVRRMLLDIGADRSVRVTASAMSALARHEWPGNLLELRMVLQHATESRTAGDITPADLPMSHRNPPAARAFTPWEQAERDAIVAALRATEGNKVQAAERLGISRNTLYRRIRSLQITV